MRPTPDWLVDEPYTDADLGVLKSGKEAQINLIERIDDSGKSCLLARKRYLPREVKTKGTLEAMGVQRASTFRHDVAYREGRQFRKTRDRRAVERMSSYGKHLLNDRWTGHEFEVMTRLWNAGMSVPYPVGYSDESYDLEYIGDHTQAAPQLYATRLRGVELSDAFDQLVNGLQDLASEGIAHGDLSSHNLLWWDSTLWFIDMPQAVDIAANPQGLNLLHRDVVNVCTWFNRRGMDVDADELFGDLIRFL